jgi:hypothetical protein
MIEIGPLGIFGVNLKTCDFVGSIRTSKLNGSAPVEPITEIRFEEDSFGVINRLSVDESNLIIRSG